MTLSFSCIFSIQEKRNVRKKYFKVEHSGERVSRREGVRAGLARALHLSKQAKQTSPAMRSPEPTLTTRAGNYSTKQGTPSDSSSDSGESGSDAEAEVYEVESIEKHRFDGSTRSFYVRWLGYPDSERSWEPEAVRAPSLRLPHAPCPAANV